MTDAFSPNAWAGLFIAFVLPNLLISSLGLFIFINRPPLNLDYLAVAVLALWQRWRLLYLLLPLLLLLDVVFALAPAWHFRPDTALMSLADAVHLPPSASIGLLVSLLFVVVLISAGLIRLLKRYWPAGIGKARWLAVLIGIGSLIAILDSPAAARLIPALDGINPASSGLNSLRVALLTTKTTEGRPVPAKDKATERLFAHLDDAPQALPERLILIVVESLGAFKSEALDTEQLRPLLEAVADRPDIELRRGRVAFSGSTVPAELRELCGLRIRSTHPQLQAQAEHCLPLRLARHGYTSHAVHGFSGAMFSRNRWYRELGFEHVLFAPELMQEGVTARCGHIFSGLCDDAVWDWITGELQKNEKALFYWLTLSAHLPLPRQPDWIDADAADCPTPVPDCALFLTHRHLFSRMAQSLARGELDNSWLILVGDHAPPYIKPQQRARFQTRHVPWLELRIPPRKH